MQLILREHVRLTDTTLHSAFTDLCQWKGQLYCAYREARTHNIVPRGQILLQRRVLTAPPDAWDFPFYFAHPHADLRDPKFLATADVLYLMCGAYLPHPAYRHLVDGVMPASTDNLIQTHVAYTTDGEHWSDLQPILRPNYWGWSGIARGRAWALAAYHVGSLGESQSITLWGGTNLLALADCATIYDGASPDRDGADYRYASRCPSEPVLWHNTETGLLGCAVRGSNNRLILGVGREPYTLHEWRWYHTLYLLHPSAVLQTKHGWLLAGRAIEDKSKTRSKFGMQRPETTTALYALEGQHVRKLLTLPSSRDTGYAGLCEGPEPDTILASWYSQHEVPKGLPGAAVYVATVEIEA